MSDQRERPSTEVDEEMRRRGLERDRDDPNKYRDKNGRNGGEAEGDWLKTNDLYWERI